MVKTSDKMSEWIIKEGWNHTVSPRSSNTYNNKSERMENDIP